MQLAKTNNIATFIVGHMTKEEGTLAGPRTLEHMVDTVLYFEVNVGILSYHESGQNRFGSTNEIGDTVWWAS